MAEPTRGLLDTSVVIDHDLIEPALLPDESAIAAMTLAELAAGPHAAEDKEERARRPDSKIKAPDHLDVSRNCSDLCIPCGRDSMG